MRTTILVLLLVAGSLSADQWIAAEPTRAPGLFALAADLHDSKVLYTDSGDAVWRTSDGGLTWTPTTLTRANFVFGGIKAEAGRSLAVAAVYLHASPPGSSSQGSHVLVRSVDGGASWSLQTINSPISGTPNDVAIEPQNPDIVYVALLRLCFFGCSRGGIIKSTNGGRTWTSRMADLDVGEIFTDPVTGSIVYAVTSSGLLRSMDGGATWRNITPPQTGAFFFDRATGVSLFVLNESSLYHSDDRGDTWTLIPNKHRPKEWTAFGGVRSGAVNPVNPSEIVVNTYDGVSRSRNGGSTWETLPGITDPHNPGSKPNVSEIAYAADGALWAVSSGLWLLKREAIQPPNPEPDPVVPVPSPPPPAPYDPSVPLPPTLPPPPPPFKRHAVGH